MFRNYDTNCPKYFLQEEKDDFINWLNVESKKQPYFVVEKDNRIVGCGGVFVSSEGQDVDVENEVGFAWGMIEEQYHGQKMGSALTKFRVEFLQSEYPNRPIVLRTSQFTELFFKKMGFDTIKHIPNGFGKGMDKNIMVFKF